jgi:hypothetical protein
MADTTKEHVLGLKRLNGTFKQLKAKIYRDLRRLGVSAWGMRKTETQYLPELIHSGEQIGGVVYGHSDAGSIMLVATDRRILYVDTKPLFKKSEDISYEVVAGITLEWVGLSGTLILHTRMGDFKVRTMNRKAAKTFREYLERRCIEHKNGGRYDAIAT